MTYQKQVVSIDNLQAEVQSVLDQFRVRYDVAGELAAAGACVVLTDLDTPRTVWCACIIHDKPETPEIDFLTVAFEVVDGAARRKSNGQVVAVCTWRNLWQELIDSYTLDAVRKCRSRCLRREDRPRTTFSQFPRVTLPTAAFAR